MATGFWLNILFAIAPPLLQRLLTRQTGQPATTNHPIFSNEVCIYQIDGNAEIHHIDQHRHKQSHRDDLSSEVENDHPQNNQTLLNKQIELLLPRLRFFPEEAEEGKEHFEDNDDGKISNILIGRTKHRSIDDTFDHIRTSNSIEIGPD
jgi:hypothetical protein